MSQKSAVKRTLPRKDKTKAPKPAENTEVIEDQESGEPELLMDRLRPHLGTIALITLAATLLVFSYVFYTSATATIESTKWADLNSAKALNAVTNDVANLTRVAEENSDSKVGLVSAMYAGDSQMRSGINQLSIDREGGLGLVRKAQRNFKFILDANPSIRSPWLTQRAMFHLAYASETLGEFAEAKKHYGNLIQEFPDSPLLKRAERGLARCSNDQFIALYQSFKDFETSLGEAPGPPTGDGNLPSGDALNAFEGIDLEPGKTPPAMSPLDKPTDPAKEEPAKTEPAKTEPAKTEPEKTEPAKKESTEIEPSKGESPQPTETEKSGAETEKSGAEENAAEKPAESSESAEPESKPAESEEGGL